MLKSCGLIIGSGWDELGEGSSGGFVETAFGLPSGPIHSLRLGNHEVLLLARHGEDHALAPHEINYRANVVALRTRGAEAVIALNTVGVITSVREPGQIAIPDQVLDYTWGREHTLYDREQGGVEHIDFTDPFSPGLRAGLLTAAGKAGIDCLDGGVYAATQGPRLESAAEVDRLERDGADYIGMTAMPEAALAREAGLDYACVAMVVNRAAGRGDVPIHDDVEANTVAARNATLATLRAFFGEV